jgi:hypothetical protein
LSVTLRLPSCGNRGIIPLTGYVVNLPEVLDMAVRALIAKERSDPKRSGAISNWQKETASAQTTGLAVTNRRSSHSAAALSLGAWIKLANA